MSICLNCGRSTMTFIQSSIDKKSLVCMKCKMEESPPTMILGHSDIHSALWWAKELRFLDVTTIEDLQKCGWFVRRVKIRKTALPHDKFNSIYYLEFYGNVKCLAVNYYNYWPGSYGSCANAFCEFVNKSSRYMT